MPVHASNKLTLMPFHTPTRLRCGHTGKRKKNLLPEHKQKSDMPVLTQKKNGKGQSAQKEKGKRERKCIGTYT